MTFERYLPNLYNNAFLQPVKMKDFGMRHETKLLVHKAQTPEKGLGLQIYFEKA